jgi:thymidylate synthase
MKVQMRSNDIFYGLTYDAPWFSTIHQTVYLNLLEKYPELQLGGYFHFSDNTHYYERHFELAMDITQEPAISQPISLSLKEPLFWARGLNDDEVDYSENTQNFLVEMFNHLRVIDELKTEDYLKILQILYNIES